MFYYHSRVLGDRFSNRKHRPCSSHAGLCVHVFRVPRQRLNTLMVRERAYGINRGIYGVHLVFVFPTESIGQQSSNV